MLVAILLLPSFHNWLVPPPPPPPLTKLAGGCMHQAVSCQARMPAQVPGLVEKRPNLIIGDIVYLRQVPASTHSLQGLQDTSAQQRLSSKPFMGVHSHVLLGLSISHAHAQHDDRHMTSAVRGFTHPCTGTPAVPATILSHLFARWT